MPLRNCRCWIFDMDGTLTIPVHDFEWMRAELGLPSGTYILEALDKMPEDEAKVLHQRLDEIEIELAEKAEAQDGAKELLEALTNRGNKLGILTRNSEQIADITLRACGLDGFFDRDTIIGRETCAPKPDPAGVTHLLSMWNADPDEAVIVGDYLFDLEAGRNAGIRTVHFDQVHGPVWPEVTDVNVSRIGDLLNYLPS